MNSLAKTFRALAIGAVVAGVGTAAYYENQNTKRETAELADAQSINGKSFTKIGVDRSLHEYSYSCNKDMRLATVEFNKLDKSPMPENTSYKATITLTDGISVIYDADLPGKTTVLLATKVASRFCHTGEFNGPTNN